MDALSNPRHVGMIIYKTGHKEGIGCAGLCSPGKELTLIPHWRELLKSIKPNVIKEYCIYIIKITLVPTSPLRSISLLVRVGKWNSSFWMVKVSCSDSYVRQPYGEDASLERQSPCINQRLMYSKRKSPFPGNSCCSRWKSTHPGLPCKAPGVQHARVEALRDAAGAQEWPQKSRGTCFSSEDVCINASVGEEAGRPEVEGRERKGTATRGFTSGLCSCQANGNMFSTWRKKQKGSASLALRTTAWCQEPLKVPFFPSFTSPNSK